jgi:putative oxidoreductase
MDSPLSSDVALLILRLGLAAVFAFHGVTKLAGKPGPRATAKFFEAIGMRPGRRYATLAALTELAVGAGLALGLATALACAAIVSLMVVATLKVTGRHGFPAERGGWEYNGVLALVAIVLAVAGPGRWSVDHALGAPGAGALGASIAIVVGAGAALLMLAVTRSPRADRS